MHGARELLMVHPQFLRYSLFSIITNARGLFIDGMEDKYHRVSGAYKWANKYAKFLRIGEDLIENL